MRLRLLSRGELERLFDRYYAEQHSSTDSFCCVTGIAVYLSLIPITVGMRRLDLVAIACAAAAMCTTLLILSRRKREWYLRRRHAVLLVHSLVHAFVGGMLMLPLTLSRKLQPATPAVFLAASLLGSSVPWHCLNALLYSFRFKKYIWMRPLILVVVLPFEWALCGTTCSGAPGSAHAFGMVVGNLRRVFAFFLPFPLLSTAGNAADSSVTSCFKLHAFLLVLLGGALPALVQRHFEKQMLREYVLQHQLLVMEDSEAAEYAALEQETAAAAAASAAPAAAAEQNCGAFGDASLAPVTPGLETTLQGHASSGGGTSDSRSVQQQGLPPRLAALREAVQKRWCEQQQGEEEAAAAAAHSMFALLAFHQRSGGSVVVLLAVLCWHVVDAVL